MIFFATDGASSNASYFSYSNMPFLLSRDFSSFSSFTLLTNAPPLLYFKKFSFDIFRLYIMMVAVHGSSGATFDLSREM